MDPESSGIVTGEKARATFEKSGLPPNVLGEIWQLADHNNLGFLSQFGFCYAMRLIGYTQGGHHPTAGLADVPGPLPRFAGLSLPSLSAQPTSSSLLQSQPSSLIPQNTATLHLLPQANISAVAPVDFQKFSQMFIKTTGSEHASLDGTAAKDIFLKAKLPTTTLGQIWSLVDTSNRGLLDLPSFVMAMHLIHGLLSGTVKQLPPFLPDYVWQSVKQGSADQTARQTSYSSIASLQSTVRHTPAQQQPLVAPVHEQSRQSSVASTASSEWAVSAAQKQQMDAIFDSLDKAKSGNLSPDQVASYLMTSRLDQQDLASIWDLSDIQNTGIFNKLEFAIALFLVNRRRAGLSLPNVVPDSLIASLQETQPVAAAPAQAPTQAPTRSQFEQVAQPAQEVKAAPKLSYDELADIFSSPSPEVSNVPAPVQKVPQNASTKSDLTYTSELPKVRQQLTSSFKPTSSFGQSLLAKKTEDTPSLIGDDVPSQVQSPTTETFAAQSQAPVQPQVQAQSAPEVNRQKTVDYEALRSVPPPPPKARTTEVSQPQLPVYTQQQIYAQPQQFASREVSGQPANNDLLADSEVSGQLSQATSDIANISTQVKSLTSQTSNLHEKKIRADQELSRILAIKEDIESKLKALRSSYANEVKQVEQVEATLATAKEETEALRSEASISEAKLNHVSGELNEKQVAVEELQKTNSALREKLGILNAEIAEVLKQHDLKAAEHTRLEKEVNVRKSQAQVSIVKLEELKTKIAELDAANQKHQEDLKKHEEETQKAEQERLAAEQMAKELETHNKSLEESFASRATTSSSGLSSTVSALAGAAVGGAVGGAAGLAGSHLFGSGEQTEAPAATDASEDTKPPDATQPSESVSKEIDPLPTQSESTTSELKDTDSVQPAGVKQTQLEPIPGSLATSDFHEKAEPSEKSDVNYNDLSVGALVDEVKDKPTEDMTGVDDFDKSEHKPEPLEETTEFEQEDISELNKRFPEVDLNDSQTNQTESVSGVTDSYRQAESVETPVTSPDNSEYRFQSNAEGVVGSLVGMPGVLVGVQRTDSMTSSVQNNASMSVRDDNIDEISERETLEETPAPPSSDTVEDSKELEGRLEDSEGERISSGVELFEIVNADEARGLENAHTFEGPTHPLAQSYVQSGSGRQPSADEEFPPIKELDIDESASSSDEDEGADAFDDAVDHISPRANTTAQNDEFDDEFGDLEPAKQEAEQDDFFGDEFNDLKAASTDNAEGFANEDPDVSLDNHFTGANEFAGDFAPLSTAPDFSAAGTSGQADANDEWEQLFAGFGNAAPAQPAAATEQDDSKGIAIDELVGMGFERPVVVEALEKNNWNLEAATNHLLDNA